MLLNGSIITIIYAVIGLYLIRNGDPPLTVLPPLTTLYLFVLLVHYLFWRPRYPH